MSSQQRNSAQQRGRAAAGDGKFRRTGQEEDFSVAVRDRLATYTRTGQACDRCKIRKIRCDAHPDGCSTCKSIGHPCRVTDRTTGDTNVRGYTRELQRSLEAKENRIRDLEALLKEKGVTVKPEDSKSGATSDETPEKWTKYASLEVKDESSPSHTTAAAVLAPSLPRTHLAPRSEITSLGVGDDSSPLSSIKGTKLVIMGTEIDTANFAAPDMDDAENAGDLYNKSVVAFTRSAMRVNAEMKIDLPDRAIAVAYAEWYINIMHAYVPVLHPPSFWKMLYRIYDEEGYQPTVIELVHLHMVLAIIYYQYGMRMKDNPEQHYQLNDLSNRHYHYCVHKTYDLMASPDVGAIQGLVLMAIHTRAFPKPGCGAFISSLAFQRALELGLHRAPKEPESGSNLALEMRKRTWWTLLTIYVAVTGRRGRPMPMAVTDFDVPLPEYVHDDCITETGIDYNPEQPKPCNWDVGMATFKIIPIMMEMYALLYSVRPDATNYVSIVRAIEQQVTNWEQDLPDGLKWNPDPEVTNNVATLYMQQFCLELRLWLRHNSVNPSPDKELLAENTRICDETARKLLRVVQQVISLKALDTTWTQMAVYAMSVFSMLVTGYERRFQMTPDKLDVLRGEMDEWLAVIEKLSQMIGCGSEIRDRVALIIESTISWIIRDMERQRAKSTPMRPKTEEPAAAPIAAHAPSAQPATHIPQPAVADVSSAQQPSTYYHEVQHSGQTDYGLGYGGQPGMAQPYQDPNVFYSAPPPQPGPMPATANAQEPGLISYGQNMSRLDPASTHFFWQRPQENTWNTWTSAISESQERFRNDLIAANPPPPATPTPRGSVGPIPAGPPAPQEVAAQWPLIMFDAAQPQSQIQPALQYSQPPQHVPTHYRQQVPHSCPPYLGEGPI